MRCCAWRNAIKVEVQIKRLTEHHRNENENKDKAQVEIMQELWIEGLQQLSHSVNWFPLSKDILDLGPCLKYSRHTWNSDEAPQGNEINYTILHERHKPKSSKLKGSNEAHIMWHVTRINRPIDQLYCSLLCENEHVKHTFRLVRFCFDSFCFFAQYSNFCRTLLKIVNKSGSFKEFT